MNTQTDLTHPSEDTLERFVMNQLDEAELDGVESHILGCNSCVTRVENLEIDVAAVKLALREFQEEQIAKEVAKQTAARKSWFTLPKLSFAGAAAATVIAVGLGFSTSFFTPAEVELSAFRGREVTTVPEWRPLHMHINARELPERAVRVEVVDTAGKEIWKGATSISHDQADVSLPAFRNSGDYLLRLYSSDGSQADNLLREFSFSVK
jgi:anti-sigma factor RsiW